jgi:hypothetical protein
MKGFTENDMIVIGKLAELGLYFTLGLHGAELKEGQKTILEIPIEQGISLSTSLMKEGERWLSANPNIYDKDSMFIYDKLVVIDNHLEGQFNLEDAKKELANL